ncbi:Fe-S cluster assembly protein SufB [Candidatus Dependentiae bacterium]|nr:Fe-S cluster assembly protein SufB [Candidatus Dependentiae bacterium]
MKIQRGLNKEIVRSISEQKQEPSWMLDLRIKALKTFESMPVPSWGPSLQDLSLDDLYYYLKPVKKKESIWDEVPADIKKTFEKLNVPQQEQEFFAGVGAQYESEMVYHKLKDEWKEQGIVFLDTDSGLKEYPDLFKEYFGSVVPYADNKFAALNSAVWSGGSFVYIPPGIQITMPLQTYFRIEAEQLGQFERTLIIVDEGSKLHYLEGCTAPWQSTSSLHCGVVEIIAKKNARIRYSTIQNWSKNIYNLVTKRAVAYQDSVVEWIFGSLGSKVTMEYPGVILKEPGARAEIISIATATTKQQTQDSGGKAIHLAPNTSSRIISKSISNNGGVNNYRGLVKIVPGAIGCKSFVQCDALILDDNSKADAYPYIDVQEPDVQIAHEARVSSIEGEKIFYLMSRGLTKKQAEALIVNGFIEPFVKQLPPEYAIEMERLMELEVGEDS